MTTQFQVGTTYWTRSICDSECIYSEKIVARTAHTVKTESGKTRRVTVYNGVEQFKPHGNYSMAAIITADRHY